MKILIGAALLVGGAFSTMNHFAIAQAPAPISTQNAAPAVADTEKQGWKLVWADEFDKDGAINSDNWHFETGFLRNEEDQWYQSQNARVEGGKLIIEARKERQPNPNYEAGSNDWKKKGLFADYTSASLSTSGKHSWQFGRFEMRGKIDISMGLWPAFWTVGTKEEWPANGEIDILEFYKGNLLANVAWGTNKRWNAKWNSKKKPVADLIAADPDWANKFHVWRMDWDEKFIRLYLDDLLLNEQDLTKTINADGRNPFIDAPQFIIVNLAIGGQNGGDPTKATYPNRFEIDYVRVYQKK